MGNKLFHVKVWREYVTDYYPTQVSCVRVGWTHAGSLKQAAYNIARKNGISTYLKDFGDAEERFCYEEVAEEVKVEEEQGRGRVIQVSVFDD